MAEYELNYLHQGTMRSAVIYAESHREAFEQLQSLQANAVVGEEILARIDAGLEIERRDVE